MSNPIERRLAYEDDHQHRRVIGQEEIAAIVQPVVILGDPGLGKSCLTKSLEAQPNMKRCRAGTFNRTDRPETWVAHGERIIVDGLDEIASSTPGGAVDTVLRQLSRMGNPPFILTCRAADWNGAADRIQIEDGYGSAPVLLHLQPFSSDDAHHFLSNKFPAIDAAGIVNHLASRGLDGIYQNPLTLGLLGEVAHQTGALPERRAELLERAYSVMLKEKILVITTTRTLAGAMRNSCWPPVQSAPHWFYALVAAYTRVPTPTRPTTACTSPMSLRCHSGRPPKTC